jgi:hypothetical protein
MSGLCECCCWQFGEMNSNVWYEDGDIDKGHWVCFDCECSFYDDRQKQESLGTWGDVSAEG